MCTVYSFDMSRIGRLSPRTQSMSLSFTPSLLSYIHPRTSPLNAVTSPCPIPTWRAVTLHRTSPRTWRARVRSWTPSGHLVGGTRHRVHMQLELFNLSFIGRLSCFALCSIHLCADVVCGARFGALVKHGLHGMSLLYRRGNSHVDMRCGTPDRLPGMRA